MPSHSSSAKSTQAGNSVVVPVINRIAEKINEAIQETDNNK